MGKAVILTFLIALMVIPIVVASEYEYLYNPYTGKLDRTRSSNQTGQNMSLGAVDINADDIALSVSNSTGGTVLKVNTTSGKLEVWHPSEGAGDYVSIAHDGTNGYIRSASGDLQFGLGAVSYWRLFTSAFYPAVVNSYDLGGANNEVRGIYLGNGTGSSGIYFGLGQENHIWAEDATLKLSTNDLQVWDNAMGTNDYVKVYHDSVTGYVSAGSGVLAMGSNAANMVWSGSTLYPGSANTADLGVNTVEWRGLKLGEDTSSGAYFGLDQDWRIYYNETSEDALIFEDSTGPRMTMDSNGVGIGTTSPAKLLEISDTKNDSTFRLSSTTVDDNWVSTDEYGAVEFYSGDGSGGGAGVKAKIAAIADGTNLNYGNRVGLAFSTYDGDGTQTLTERMRIGKSGFVGIGQTSPAMALHVGGGSSSHSLTNSQNDTYITGKLEVDGVSFFDSSLYQYSGEYFQDDIRLNFGTGNDALLEWDTGQATEHTIRWALGDTANSIIFGEYGDRTKDFDHPAQSNPTIFMQSNEDPDTNNTQWGSIAHDTSSFVIDSGTDSITLDDSTNVAGNLALGDNILGDDKFRMCYNGSESVMDMYSNNGSLFSCSVNNTGSFICSSVSTWSCT